MESKVETIFFPSTGVELVLNLNSLHPSILPSIIYDADFSKQTFIIDGSIQFVKSSTKFKEMHITTLIQRNGIKQRVGLRCIPTGSSDKYKLSNGKNISVIKLKYALPVLETNIRSGYRLSLNNRFMVKAIIKENEKEFHSSKDFTVKDISLSGMGILIPKKLGNRVNPLTKIKIYHQTKIKTTLIQKESVKPADELTTDIEVRRINTYFNDFNFLAGLKFINLEPENEEKLNQFIHQAQIDELKKFSGL